jgi:adenylyltransferase/sulfurtransferase
MSRVVVVGAGGLGCPALLRLGPALAARGDSVVVVDDDVVDVSNLQRQILHRNADVGRPKVDSARDALLRRWPELHVDPVQARVAAANVTPLIAGAAVVLDGSDTLATKFLLNDACVAAGVPLVHGAVAGWTGQLMAIVPGSACFRCLFESEPPAGAAPSCQEAGVVGAFAGVIGALMAKEALALLAGAPTLAGALLVVDGRSDRRRRVAIRPRSSCAAHGFPSEIAAC